jgi:hypothetical protein
VISIVFGFTQLNQIVNQVQKSLARHARRQVRGHGASQFLDQIDYLIKRAEELKIRDKLVVVIQSEMGRTPHYNKGQGKDHWSVGSIMFMGQGIKGNRVIGETDDGQFLTPINPENLTLDKDKGIRVRPEHLHQALREHANVADHAYSKKFPMKVPAGERLINFFGQG